MTRLNRLNGKSCIFAVDNEYMDQLLTLEEDIRQAVETMRKGGIILYPTDTVWGIGCDASRSDAVRKVFELKRRADAKAMITLVSDLAMLERYVDEVPEVAYQLVECAVDPTTVVYDHGVGVAPELLAPDGSIGIRLTSEAYSRGLCRALRRPVVSTSANISGSPTPQWFGEIADEILSGVDYVASYRRNDREERRPSSVIKLSADGTVRILRK